MSINLSKLFFNNLCLFCNKKVDKIEFYKNQIASKQHQIDLIYENLMGFFSVRDYNSAIYVIVWLDNKIKQFHVNILLSKENSEILTLFKFFLSCIEYNMNKCTRIRIDNNIEYLNEDFIKFTFERDIRFEFIIAKNFQINNNVKRFNQILMRKINIFFKNNNLVFK